ncbi:MAG: carboxypeptidase-like regulatory domain-containing protein [Planctomycetaceae bacterium]|nr:carboxypeptidase-like regulatory domain-containing protein [Planctomycetaceae bacterium]
MSHPVVGSFARWGRWSRVAVLAMAAAAGTVQSAWALIMGGEGHDPIRDPGWPKGAAEVFNSESRVAYWEGPPFGGGQWHAECRGDALALSVVLENFSQIETPDKRVVLHNGIGNSFWLNPNREPEKRAKAMIDWRLMVWQPDRLKFQRELPAGLRPVDKTEKTILAQLDVYTNGFVRWEDVIVPEKLEVIDERLEAHGFTAADGTVLEGRVIDLATQQPLNAKLRLEKMASRSEGGSLHTRLVEVDADAAGHWVVKNAPPEHCRLVLTADGYVPRVIAYARYDDQPRWSEHNSGLSKPASVTGRVVDDQGKPLADVEVRIGDLAAKNGGRYEIAADSHVQTDADGRFRFDGAPVGTASVWIHKSGYVRPGLGPTIETPATDLELEMRPSAQLKITVDFSAAARPEGYIVHVIPEGGEKVGKWSGSGNIDAEGGITYEDIPPGRYVVRGRPNPGSDAQQTPDVLLDLKGGKQTEVTIKAR